MSVGNVFATIATCTGAGAFVDFYIGKSGQKRVKDWLEIWWYRLSDIPVRAVGQEEALNALRVIDYLFGPKLFSWKRLRSAAIFKLISLCIYPGIFLVDSILVGIDLSTPFLLIIIYLSALDVVNICLSMSVSRMIIRAAMYSMRGNRYLNIALIVVFICAQILTILYLSKVVIYVTAFGMTMVVTILDDPSVLDQGVIAYLRVIFSVLIDNLQLFVSDLNPMDQIVGLLDSLTSNPFAINPSFQNDTSFFQSLWVITSLKINPLLINSGRLLLALAFFGSYILVPAWPRILTLYARIIESDKPVFTVVGAGIGGFASAISALLK